MTTTGGHTHTRHDRPSSTSRHTSARTPSSAGQPMAPLRPNSARSPAARHIVRTPSPNYFALSIDSSQSQQCISSSGGQHARSKWSPPASNVRSTAATSPRIIPLDQNPDFDIFRRQTEKSGFTSSSLSTFTMGRPPSTSRAQTQASNTTGLVTSPSKISPRSASSPRTIMTSTESPAPDTKQRSPKRLLSSPVPSLTDRPRRNSPAGFTEREAQKAPWPAHLTSDDRQLRLSLPTTSASTTSSLPQNRADTLPASLNDKITDPDGPVFVTSHHVFDLLEKSVDEVLLLDLRVSTQYAKSKISAALNLCIPTTLLKRPSYDHAKLAETFKSDEQRKKFERWRSCNYIIVYDSNSSKVKDAGPCVKMLEKFTNDGWKGAAYILRGGFMDFAKKFPSLISNGSSSAAADGGLMFASGHPTLPPVIGGCPMPVTANAANPFFSNIRQNMDLIGGVGQIPPQRPSSMSKQQEDEVPKWLHSAVKAEDNGKSIADKFLHIEQREQKRMQDALSDTVVYGTPRPEIEKPVQLAGIEKGSKNRYNNIWPFEHSRVKIEGVATDSCDYFNANYIHSEWSNKRYIATQGPIPATFTDFWRVVWQQDARVIVMLTAEKEGGQLKAHNYWDAKRYGPFNLKFLSEWRAALEPSRIHHHRDNRPALGERRSTNPQPGKPSPSQQSSEGLGSSGSEQPYVIVRRFTLSHNEEPFARMREVTQLQYSSWPDFGAPAHPTHLLGLVEQCDAVVRASSGSTSESRPESPQARPVVVHCSAGCGRTGTFCTVDSVIDILKRQRRGAGGASTAQRGIRQPTPMDIDTQSASNSFAFPAIPSESLLTPHARDQDHWVDDESVDLIEKTVQDFRKQRISMVQSLRQYVLCYETVLEWLCEQTPKTA